MSTLPASPTADPQRTALDVGFDRASLTTMGPPIAGPTAMGSDARRFWRLAWTLAITDFKLRFFGSVLGYLWQLIRPLMLFGVIYTVFSLFLRFSKGVHYPVSLLMGIVLYTFFAEVTAGSVRSLVNREPLVRKIDFPRLAVPMAVLLTALINVSLNLIPVFVFLIASGGEPRLEWLELPLIVGWIAVLGFGLGMLLSSLFVRFRDIDPIWEVVLQAMFYGTPIFWTLDSLTGKVARLHWLPKVVQSSPFASALQQARHAIIDPSYQGASATIGGLAWLMIPIGLTAALFALGFLVFRRIAPTIAEDL